MIKNVVIIGLCSLLALEAIFPDVDMADLSRLPDLLSHFKKHRSESPELSFAEFLSLHYDDSDHLATTPADHQRLPFSKRHRHRVPLQIVQEIAPIYAESTYGVIMKIEPPIERAVRPSNVATQVWQPPRA